MKKLLIALITVPIFLLFIQNASAQEDIPILFTLDTCTFCQQLKADIKEKGWDKEVEFVEKEASSEENALLFYEKMEECGLDTTRAAVPMMYHNGECTVSSALISSWFLSQISPEEFTTQTTEEIAEEETATPVEETEDQTLSTVLDGEKDTDEREVSYSFITLLTMILVPSILIAVGYLMIKYFKL